LGAVLAIFAALELGVRAVGGGDPMAFGGSKLLYQQIYPPLFVPGSKPDTLRPRDPRLVDRSFSEKSPPERVFVFGESAVRGLGMSENASFSRALERQLRNVGRPDQVVNVGVVALDSRQIIACVKDVTRTCKPDWVVLHVGNNEFLETHAWRFLKARHALPMQARVDDVLASSRLYLALKHWGTRRRTRTLTPEMFSIDSLRGGGGGTGAAEDPGSERELVKAIEGAGLGVTPEEIDAAAAKHKENMRTAIQLAKDAGARVILMTVATNLEWEGVRDPEGGWLKKAQGSSATLEEALAAHDKLLAGTLPSLDKWHGLYERAVIKRALGDMKGAHEDFQRANDEDPHLRRCLAKMNENMRDLAKEMQVTLVDGERVLAAASKDGITGFEMLYDYVHFTPEGNERLGAELAKKILGSTPAGGGSEATLNLDALAAKVKEVAAFVAKRRDLLASRTQDALEVLESYGWNADRAILSDRDLWKAEKAHDALDHVHDPRKPGDPPDGKVQLGTATSEELVWAANWAALKVGGEAHARELYEKAKKAKPELAAVVDANLKWMDAR
jgi:lysophospholipase L1-like esterase